MSGRQKGYIIVSMFALVFLLVGGGLWGWHRYQSSAFQRAYEQGNAYEQLNSLMNTTRYAKEVRKAGYSVDDYGLKMNERIDNLTTKTTPAVVISVPTKSGIDTAISLKENERFRLEFNSEMKLVSILYYKDGKYLLNNEISKEEQEKYEAFVRKAIAKTIKDIYDSMAS
ncbi:hypothetical protein ACVR1G_07375 [Streptococcus dentasini]